MWKALLLAAALAVNADAAPKWPRVSTYKVEADPKPATPALSAADATTVLGIQLGAEPKLETIQKLSQSIVDEPTPSKLFELAMEFTKASIYKRAAGDVKSAQQGKDFLIKAVKTYKALLDNDQYLAFAQRDIALFHYAWLLQDAKYMKEARAVYEKLIKDYPNSVYVPAAYVAFADYYEQAAQTADAEAFYKKVLAFPKSNAAWLARYRLGWIQMRAQRYQEALESMFEVAKGAPQPALVAAARTDFVAAYAEIGKPERALEAFKRVDAAAAPAMFEALGARYLAKQDVDRAAIVARALGKVGPGGAAIAETLWRRAEAGDKPQLWVDAGVAFTDLARDTGTPAATSRDAALAAVLAYANALGLDPDLAKLDSPGKKLTPLSKIETAYSDAVDIYATLTRDSKDTELGRMRFVLATLHRKHADHANAVPVLVDFVHWQRESPLAESAARMLLDSLLAQGKTDEALEMSGRFAADADFMTNKPELQRTIDLVRSRSPRR